MKRALLSLAVVLFCQLNVEAQNPFDKARQNVGGGNTSAFNQNRVNNFNEYRQKLNVEYISKTREKWNDFNANRALIDPNKDMKPVKPIEMSDEDARRDRKDTLSPINICGGCHEVQYGGQRHYDGQIGNR